jgi:hypothetical protein
MGLTARFTMSQKISHLIPNHLQSDITPASVSLVGGNAPDRRGDQLTVIQQETQQTVKVGDILVSSWGYDQTNVDFYEVVKTTEKTVWFISIGSKIVDGNGHRGSVIPDREVRGEKISRRKNKSGWHGQVWIDLNSFSGATLWEGKPQWFSWDR